MKTWKERLKKFTAAFTIVQMVLMFLTPVATYAATIDIVGWTFTGETTAADIGVNKVGSSVVGNGITNVGYKNGPGGGQDDALWADGWASGDSWEIDFDAEGYSDLTVSADFRSSSTGPGDFEVFCNVDGGAWNSLGSFFLDEAAWRSPVSNWSMGICENSADVHLKFEVSSGSRAPGNGVLNTVDGANRIDNILIIGNTVAPITYNISGVASPLAGGSVSGGGSVVSGGNATLTATSASGYHFVNWSGDCTGVANPYTLTNITSVKSCTANFAQDTYTVSFDSNGGSVVSPISGVLYDQTITAPTPPTRLGYDFAGWYSDAGLTTLWNFSTATVKNNLTLYASWNERFTFTFESNGGSYVPAAGGLHYGELVPEPSEPTKAGNTFDGWFSDPELTTTWDFSLDEVTGSKTLYAKWEIDIHTVTFDSTGGSFVGSESVNYGDLAVKPSDPIRTGYDFDGWYPCGDVEEFSLARFVEQPGCEVLGNEWNFDTDFVTDDATLYAKWNVAAYTITFDSNGGTIVDPITQYYDTAVTAPVPPTRVGYTFTGWTPTVPPTMPAENITLVAGWSINSYTITFDSAGGTAVAPITQVYGTAITSPTTPTRAGFAFTGWTPTVPGTMPAEDLTLVAGWTVLVPLTPPIIPAVVAAAVAPVAAAVTPTTPTTPSVQAAETVAPTTTEEPAAVKGSSDTVCPWWWIIALILLVVLAFMGGVMRALHENNFVRKYYYIWPPVLAAVAWLAHRYLQDGLQPTWLCNNYWFVALLAAVIGEIGFAYLLRDKKAK